MIAVKPRRFGAHEPARAQSATMSPARAGGATQDASVAGIVHHRDAITDRNSNLSKQENPMLSMYHPAVLQRALTRIPESAALPMPTLPCPARLPARVALASKTETLADAMTFINNHLGWDRMQKQLLKTCVSSIGRAVAQIRACGSNQPFGPKQVDLASIAFDVPTINRNLERQSYRQAGFKTAKSFTNAKWGFRRVCRVMGKITSKHRSDLPPDSPYARFIAASPPFRRSVMKRFASELHHMGIPPEQVQDTLVTAHGDRLLADMVGVNVPTTLRWIVRVWNRAAQPIPEWPRLSLPNSKRSPASSPLSVYSSAIQEEIVAVRHWMEGGMVPGMAGCNPARVLGHGRRPARRPSTIECRLKHIRLLLGVYVSFGHDPQAISSLRCLLTPPIFWALLQALWERGQGRQELVPEAERDHDESGVTRQMDMAAQTLMMLANYCFPQPPEVLRELRELTRKARKPTPGEMTPKNQQRLRQLEDPIKLGLLLNLAADLMAEAMKLRDKQPAEAARRARAAVMFAIECRIPLRIQNLASCRIGHNLRFSGTSSKVVTLGFQAHEMKNKLAVEYAVGPRLLKLLQMYITHFLPFLAEGSPDFAEKQWLFPADRGRPGHLSISRVREIICDTMAERVGVAFHPHLFRALAVHLSLSHPSGSLEHARQLLGDKSMEVVTRYYVPVRRREAARQQDTIVEAEAERLATLAAVKRQRGRRGGRS